MSLVSERIVCGHQTETDGCHIQPRLGVALKDSDERKYSQWAELGAVLWLSLSTEGETGCRMDLHKLDSPVVKALGRKIQEN